MGVDKQLQVPGVCEPVVAVIELVVVVGGFVLCHLLLGCGCVGCELSRLCLDWLGCDLTLVELTLPW